jgi:hypothetical protein
MRGVMGVGEPAKLVGLVAMLKKDGKRPFVQIIHIITSDS